VTGASGGIGRAIAVALAAAGARVGLVARSRQGLEETQRLIGHPGTQVFCTDLRDEKAIERLTDSVSASFGAIDILVNTAGVWHDERVRYHGPRLWETPVERIHEVFEVGVRAPFLLTRLLLPRMVQKRAGKILQISAAFAGGPRGGAGWLHYYVANRAIVAFTEALAVELREYAIQVNCIAPWFVATEAVQRFYASELQTYKALEPSEVADVAVFLLSPAADHISGQVIEVRSKHDHR
jgi:NAD(P)-dependent dehydrogenase (short-subunit alcohol dehydrogenase family)